MPLIPVKNIGGLRFGVMSDDDVRRGSAAIVETDKLFEKNIPVEGGLYDQKMGSNNHKEKCATCGQKRDACLGHYGHIELKTKVHSPMFLKDIFRWLRIICHFCGQTVSKTRPTGVSAGKILNAMIATYSKSIDVKSQNRRQCEHCGSVNPNITRMATHVNMFGTSNTNTDWRLLLPHKIYEIFDRIPDAVVVEMGKTPVNHPRNLIIQTLVVPGNHLRPVKKETMEVDNITLLYKKVLQTNMSMPSIKPNQEVPERSELEKKVVMLCIDVYNVIKNAKAPNDKSAVKECVSISGKFPGKEGFIRKNLTGKRCLLTARSFITCDPGIDLYTVGVPLHIAMCILIPITVREYNYEECKKFFLNKHEYPGCTRVEDGITGNVKTSTKVDNIKIGDIIYRHLIDGDIFVFNRQPTLQGSCCVAQTVRVIMIGHSFRFNVIACKLYNADFDGDAMNMYITDKESIMKEIQIMCGPENFVIDIKSGKPFMGQVHDSLYGVSRLTRTGVTINRGAAMQMFSNIPITPNFNNLPISVSDDGMFSGRDMVSILLKSMDLNINYTGVPSMYIKEHAKYIKYNADDVNILIDHGILRTGILDKKSVGQEAYGGLVHLIHNEYSAKAALDFTFYLQRVSLNYLQLHGCTIGISDIYIHPDQIAEINKIKSGILAESKEIARQLYHETIIPPIGVTTEQFYEQLQMNALDPGDGIWEHILKGIDCEHNNLYHVIMAGVRGNLQNFKNINTGIGQIAYGGKRYTTNYNNRSGMVSMVNDNDPVYRGYVSNSFSSGLSPKEIFFHCIENRNSLISKALTTSVAGSINRRSIKSSESLIVDNIRKVFDGSQVIQCLYNVIGTDPRYIVSMSVPTIGVDKTPEQIAGAFLATPGMFDKKYATPELPRLLTEEFAAINRDRARFFQIFNKWQYLSDTPFTDKALVPFDIINIIKSNKYKTPDLETRNATPTPETRNATPETRNATLDPSEALNIINELIVKLPYCLVHPIQYEKKRPLAKYMQDNLEVVRIYTRSILNLRTLLKFGVSTDLLRLIVREIKTTYIKTLIDYGKLVGILASQCLSEPLTQEILNARHKIGGGTNKTKSMQRINEIIGMRPSDKMKSIGLTFYLQEPECFSEVETRKFATFIEVITTGMFVDSWLIFYEKFGEPTHPNYKYEKEMIDQYLRYSQYAKPTNLTNWCIRISLNKFKLIEKNISVHDIYIRLNKTFPGLFIVHSSENSKEIIMRLYLGTNLLENTKYDLESVKSLAATIFAAEIRGIRGIKAAGVYARKVAEYNEKTGTINNVTRFIISTTGTNILDLCCYHIVNKSTIHTDSIMDMFGFLGITAARNKIFTELSFQIESNIPPHHTIFTNIMTSRGLSGIDRYGNGKRNNSTLSRIAEGSAINNLQEAAINGELDNFRSPIPNVMFGAMVRAGTSYNQLGMNMKLLNGIRANMKSDYISELL